MNLALRCGRGHSWAKVTRGPSSQRHVELCTSNSVPTRIATFDRVALHPHADGVEFRRPLQPRRCPATPTAAAPTALLTALVQSVARLRMFDDRQTARLPAVARLALTTSGIADVRSAAQEGRPMFGTVVFRGVPNQQESASRSASAAVSVGSAPTPPPTATQVSDPPRRFSGRSS
jgi:hypothetical protein